MFLYEIKTNNYILNMCIYYIITVLKLLNVSVILWTSLGRRFCEAYIANANKPMYNYKIFSVKYVIHNVC